MAQSKKTDYQALQQELDAVLELLEDPATDIDAALKAYERGVKLIAELEGYLKTAENKVREIKANFSDQA